MTGTNKGPTRGRLASGARRPTGRSLEIGAVDGRKMPYNDTNQIRFRCDFIGY
jgi:hypothetical protein